MNKNRCRRAQKLDLLNCGYINNSDNYCIFHKPDKNKKEAKIFYRELKNQGEKTIHPNGRKHLVFKNKINWQGYIFPKPEDESIFCGSFTFEESDKAFTGTGAEFQQDADLSQAVFEGKFEFLKVYFLSNAIFQNVKFNDEVTFFLSYFGGKTDFSNSTFKDNIYFTATILGNPSKENNILNFEEVTFKGEAHFSEANFNNKVFFSSTVFTENARFDLAKFFGETHFTNVKFNSKADFSEAKFCKNKVIFNKTIFHKIANFSDIIFESKVDFSEVMFQGGVYFQNSIFQKLADFSKATFICEENISCIKARPCFFTNAIFKGKTKFNDSVIQGSSSFRNYNDCNT